jgi:hypothetical protein
VSYAVLYYNAFREQISLKPILHKKINEFDCSVTIQKTVQKLVSTLEKKCKFYENGRYYCYKECIFKKFLNAYSCLPINTPLYMNEYDSQNYRLCFESRNNISLNMDYTKQCNKFCEMSCIQEYTSFVEKCEITAQLTSSIKKFSKVKIILKNEPQITYINDYAMKLEDFILGFQFLNYFLY